MRNLGPKERQGSAHWHKELTCPSEWPHQHYKWGAGDRECVTNLVPSTPPPVCWGSRQTTQSLCALVFSPVRPTDCILFLGWVPAVRMGRFGAFCLPVLAHMEASSQLGGGQEAQEEASPRLSEQAGLRAMGCSNPGFPDGKTEGQEALVLGHTALGGKPGLLPDA